MNKSIFLKLAALTLLAVIATTGCKSKGPKGVTPIYGRATQVGPGNVGTPLTNDTIFTPPVGTPGSGVANPGPGTTIPSEPIRPPVFPPVTPDKIGPGGGPATDTQLFDNMLVDRSAFAANMIHFDYDKAIVKQTEEGKLKPVIAALKSSPQNKLLIEGHCDERGTEEYNRALGERRALAIRERLAKAGVKELLVISQDTSAYGRDLNYADSQIGSYRLRTRFIDLARALGDLNLWIR